MKNDDLPVRDTGYVLEQIDNDYQLRQTAEDNAIYINATAALLWELCDGRSTVGGIKQVLHEAYPDAGNALDADVDEALAMLVEHGALSTG